jgi:hypothetical protein
MGRMGLGLRRGIACRCHHRRSACGTLLWLPILQLWLWISVLWLRLWIPLLLRLRIPALSCALLSPMGLAQGVVDQFPADGSEGRRYSAAGMMLCPEPFAGRCKTARVHNGRRRRGAVALAARAQQAERSQRITGLARCFGIPIVKNDARCLRQAGESLLNS